MDGFRTLRRNHDFTVLWVGQTVSELGSQLSLFVYPLLGYALTGSAFLASLAGGANLLGMALALLPAGLLADRVDRARLMRISSGSGVVLFGSLVVAGAFGVLTLPQLLVVALLTGAGSGLFQPAETAAIRTVVPAEQLPTALSQNQARQHVAALLGGPVGGLLYALTSWVPFLVDALSFAFAWLLQGRLRSDLSPAPRPGPRPRASADIAEGLRFSWRHPFFRTILVWGALSNLVINALFITAILRLVQAGFAPWSIGLVDTAAGAFGLLGAVLAPTLINRFATGRLTVVVAWSFVPLLVPLVLWNNPALVAAALSLGVLLNPAGNAGIGSYRLAVTPPELIGRTQSTSSFVTFSTMPLASVLGGGLLALLGGPGAMVVLTVLTALVALVPTLSASVRSVPKPSEWTTSAQAPLPPPAPAPAPAPVPESELAQRSTRAAAAAPLAARRAG